MRSRQVNHKFHYDSVKQTLKWLALHEAYSPAQTDPDCGVIYQKSFIAAVENLRSGPVHVIGLGCGGGQKDLQLLKLLRAARKEVFYTPCDVSTAMVLVAREVTLEVVAGQNCFPLVCDLATATDLPAVLGELTHSGASRILTFFGLLPNFESSIILPRLSALVGPQDILLVSANLAPGPDYRAGVRRILPLYDNELTREWLLTFLLDLGVVAEDGELRIEVEADATDKELERIAVYFHFTRERRLGVHGEPFRFSPGESVRLFFSYRHTPALVGALLAEHGLQVLEQWCTASEEEGVFLVRKLAAC